MGRLIIDGESVFEIDEDCFRRRPPEEFCELRKYFANSGQEERNQNLEGMQNSKRDQKRK